MKSFYVIDKDDKIVQQVKGILEGDTDFIFLEKFFIAEEELLIQFLKDTPDLVFLDLDDTLTDIRGFLLQIARYFPDLPTFIAMSSQKEKAYDAFLYELSGFLLKPLTESDIRKYIAKYKIGMVGQRKETICLKSHKDYQYIRLDEIMYLEADNNATDFYLSNGSRVSAYKTLKTFQRQLPVNFLRIHKSYIINSLYVSRINYSKSRCSLRDLHQKIPFTKTFIDNIHKINNSLSLKAQHVF